MFVPQAPSVQARIAHAGARLFVSPLEHVIPSGPLGVRITRRVIAGFMALVSERAAGVEVQPVDVQTRAHGRIKGEWALPEGSAGDGVVLYIHGSGYNLCSVGTHRALVTQIAKRSGLTVFSTEYRLAPEHPFPAAPDDVARAYDWLLAQGWSPDQVVIAGDSAGGHMTLGLGVELLRDGRELPAGLVMLSPLADPSCDLMEQREQLVRDPLISADGVRRLFAHYLRDTDPKHPRLTHVLVEGEVLPPTLIQAGGAEFLAADAHHIHDMLAAVGTDVTLEVWPGQLHVFQAQPRIVPEAHRALDRATTFMTGALARRRAERSSAEVTA
ncbi:alpha/beta hydrolase [Nocardioides marmorisolisilvae]|uniref:Alpha/beta hydrolase n=1 Tax=Nocardioides marmorisolisilvae TaxID=1542737 RepID=A0A3N0DQ53_9ACTN|nr:alpha/beta hydrolase [Nocardioides marmorisolisilvae]RNL77779.1 alpha/beta hydrolase [Nocardioides marmorisolisilvae]